MTSTLAVIGGGVIGLTCALRALESGWQVTVFDNGERGRASWVAAAMLGDLGEGHPGEERQLELAHESGSLWPALLAEIGAPGGDSLQTATETLFVGFDRADLDEFARLASTVWTPDDDVAVVDVGELTLREPMLSPRVRGGYLAKDEGALDNRRVVQALADAVIARGGQLVTRRIDEIDEMARAGDRHPDQILLTAGIDTRRLCPRIPLIAQKGEAVRLRAGHDTSPPPSAVVRAKVHGRDVYIVPRHDGVVVGATQYEVADADDLAPRIGGVKDLLDDAFLVMPGLREYRLADITAAMRPATPDGLPVVGRLDDHTLVATGHGREGMMLAPLTGALVADLLDGSAAGSAAVSAGRRSTFDDLSPRRFT